MIPWVKASDPLPPAESAMSSPDGLVAAGLDLSVPRLLDAYSKGIFPWFSQDDPVFWWSPQERMGLRPSEIKISRSLAKTLRNAPYRVSTDMAFDKVIQACASSVRESSSGTWITPEMIQVYCEFHQAGYAHSFEVWSSDNQLIGGLYGVALGQIFFGESMFHLVRDASKIAFVHMAQCLAQSGFQYIDCQMYTDHLATLGASKMQRPQFLTMLKQYIQCEPNPCPWEYQFSNDSKRSI